MISYEVTLDIDPRFAEGVETYMRQKHIPEIFSTGLLPTDPFRARLLKAVSQPLPGLDPGAP